MKNRGFDVTRLFDLALPALRAIDPELAHQLSIKALAAGLYPRASTPDDPRLGQNVLGLRFPNPVGLAAGLDKNAEAWRGLFGFGFGFVEIGTATPLPQSGNPRPRMFRLEQDRGVINRLGFNNEGHSAALDRLAGRRDGVLGVNLGANKDAADRIADYALGVSRFAGVADYLTINISSPNTPGLRDLQAPEALASLLAAVMEARAASAKPGVPVLIKLAPDIADDDLAPIVETIVAGGADGIIISNTTLARDGLASAHRSEAGGLSGRPLFARSTRMLARVRLLTGGSILLVGVGGVDSPDSALAKIEAGASLIQLYTGLVYEGPGLVARIKAGLIAAMAREGLSSIAPLIGRRAEVWAV